MSVVRWSSKPEIAKLWLLRNSTSVAALRVDSAGTVESADGDGVAIVQCADFRRYVQT